ncbi:MAG TPA: halocarboxylic acid dehydrogenase DehI family protein [Terriglobales bacterium]|nr:halocarboxylic acid dehydrogenase DehI family protein [Terriglobales bacterium]
MPLTRMYEETEVSSDLQRVYGDIRASFDVPWVPSTFKLAAGCPAYLKTMWDDLGPVARSKEFQTASRALEEFVRSLAVSDGWHFSSQARLLAAQKFSIGDIEQLGGILSVFLRSIPKLVLFSRLMQRGYSGGQSGRVSAGKQASALARMMTLNVPNEREAGIRTWLIYNDIRKAFGMKNVSTLFRVISPYPGYLASVWMDSKKLMSQPTFVRAKDEVSRRSLGLVAGLPVRDHRKHLKDMSPDQWRDVEEMVDNFARLAPQFALVAAVWQRSFPQYASQNVAA